MALFLPSTLTASAASRYELSTGGWKTRRDIMDIERFEKLLQRIQTLAPQRRAQGEFNADSPTILLLLDCVEALMQDRLSTRKHSRK